MCDGVMKDLWWLHHVCRRLLLASLEYSVLFPHLGHERVAKWENNTENSKLCILFAH